MPVAQAAVHREKAELERLKGDYERQARLYKRELIAAQEYDSARAAYQMATKKFTEAKECLNLAVEGPRKQQIAQGRAALVEAQERFALIRRGPRQETIDQACARLEQAKQTLALAETQLGYTTLVSPVAGVVLSKNGEPEDHFAAGTPVVAVGDPEPVWLRAYIKETDLGLVKIGQRVAVTTNTYPGKVYEGCVFFLASQA